MSAGTWGQSEENVISLELALQVLVRDDDGTKLRTSIIVVSTPDLESFNNKGNKKQTNKSQNKNLCINYLGFSFILCSVLFNVVESGDAFIYLSYFFGEHFVSLMKFLYLCIANTFSCVACYLLSTLVSFLLKNFMLEQASMAAHIIFSLLTEMLFLFRNSYTSKGQVFLQGS